MKKIIAFAGSTSSTSINKQLVIYTASLLQNVETKILDLNDYPLPVFSVDLEKNGFPIEVSMFLDQLKKADGFIVSLAEHNGNVTAAFKNLLDWTSRMELKMFFEKPMLLMSTCNGARAAKLAFEYGQMRFPRHGANIVSTFSLPEFKDNFSDGKVVNEVLNDELKEAINSFQNSL
ncbi:NAD(P)H-dependent oxidoreductase [Subsaxibacter sp. CAU 1640]|uniref:NADPH-dependent FMN reductase n=1 Tax=Subsaxibacter sp. CAU 1640 TaxID=2933271 RepID=UPI002005BF59|nr:NADPH-dependent FMN reductase [Subsaxibacter sp. CAU 1640]MCK7590537.1 NAD(P)H-dependent oxidoreductase [Subsaxibacter sp. CAU 1640]